MKQARRRSTTIRASLFRSMMYLIVLSCGVALATTWVGQRKAVTRLSALLVESTSERVDAELRAFFVPVSAGLAVIRDQGEYGFMPSDDPGSFNTEFIPFLQRFPQVSSVNTGDADGNGLLLLRRDDVWVNREVHVDEWGTRTRWHTWANPEILVDVSERELDYDPRNRPWYTEVIETEAEAEAAGEKYDDHPRWTAPYTFFTTGDPGITAAVRVKPPDREPFVLAYDVLLNDVSGYTSGLAPTERGMALIMTDDTSVIGLPRDPRFQDAQSRQLAVLQPASALGVPAVAAAIAECEARGGFIGEPFSFRVDGEAWWGGFRPFSLDEDTSLWIAVLVPEDDFLADVKRQRTLIAGTSLGAMVCAFLLAIYLSRRYSQPLTALAQQSVRFQNLDLAEGGGISSDLTEIRDLADAQERMRGALDSFARYVPTDLVRELLAQGQAARIGGESRKLTILFTDLHGFTPMSERMSADELVDLMARYFETLLGCLTEGGATIDKLLGDGLVGFWGAPKPRENHTEDAVRAVLECRARMAEASDYLRPPGHPPLRTRFGLATGLVVVGNVGSKTRLDYTALGDAVNVASRLEGLNREYGTEILATPEVRKATESFVHWREVDSVRVRGRTEAISVHDPLGLIGEVSEERLEWARRYEEALGLYRRRQFAEAAEILSQLEPQEIGSATALRLRVLCTELKENPPGEGWDGTSDSRM